MEKESSYSMWKALCNVYEKKRLAGQSHQTFEEILRQLRETGAVVSEDDKFLGNLSEESLNVDVIKGKLRDEVERRLQPNSDKSGDKTSVAFTAKQKFNGNCNSCGKYGHKARYCYNRFGGREKSTIQNHYHNNEQYSRVENQNYPGRFMNYQRPNRFASQPRHSKSKRDFEEDRKEHELKFFVDSGCTDHLVKDDTKNGGFINAIGVGNIKAVSYFAKKKTECEIKNVLHVPELRRNLLSVKKLKMNGMTVKLENGEVKLLNKNGDCFGSGKRDKLYEIEFKVGKLGCYETEIENEELTTWHQRLWSIERNKVIVSRNEKFNEREFPYLKEVSVIKQGENIIEPDDSEITKFQQEVEEDKLEGVPDGYNQEYNSKRNRQLPIRFNDYELYLAYEAFTDGNQSLEADWANEEGRKSISGYMYKWNGQTILWSTKKQYCTSLSTAEAELISRLHSMSGAADYLLTNPSFQGGVVHGQYLYMMTTRRRATQQGSVQRGESAEGAEDTWTTNLSTYNVRYIASAERLEELDTNLT
ncbi:hypothetical protein ILUMI_26209 [Ignelater luminosus]|uniref:CCHC-type domain-containing protein n=1 Tax=Ignelater luminosus TaxID=2038154 RepID=A0A8K0C648_IGNLU|nr:hypothetical protein ILUMI_26209 [Ignelater luminosus]